MTSAEAALSTGRVGFHRNPIFNRELVTLLRSRKAFLLLAIYLAISIALVLTSWPREAATLLLQGELSRQIFSLFALGQTLLLALLIPATLGSCMTTEKEGETLDLLLTTPVSADQILVGKLLSGIFYFLLLQLVSVPVLLLCFIIGGLAWEDVLGLYLYLLGQLVLYGLTSVACSIYFHRTHIAVILSYVFVGAEALVLRGIYGDGIGLLSSGAGLGIGVVLVGPALGLYAVARAGVRRPYTPVRKSIEEEDVSQIVGLVIRREHYPDKLIVPPRRMGLLEDGVNPVLDKELQTEIYGSGSLFIRLVIQLGLFLSLGAFFWVISATVRGGISPDLHPEYPYFCFIIGYVMVLGPSIASTCFTHEKEQHTIESLVLTLIPRRQIVLGKFLAIARVVGALAFLNCLGFLIVVFVSSFNFAQLLTMAALLASVTAFATALGMFLSLHCRTTLTAAISTYFLLFAVFIGPLLAETFLTRLSTGFSPKSFGFLTYLSPFLSCRLSAGGEARQLQAMGIHLALYGSLTAALLGTMTARFERVIQKQAHTL